MSSVRKTFLCDCAVLIAVLVLSAGCAKRASTVAIVEPSAQDMVPADITQDLRTNESVLGVGDTVNIEVHRHDDLKRSLRIDANGMITYPLIGDVKAAGLNAVQLRATMQEALSKYLVDPQVIVNIGRMPSQKVYVLGEVLKPGVIGLETPMSILEAISYSGGFTNDAKNENVIVIRGDRNNPRIVKLDMERLLEKGDLSQDIQVRAGDVVFVPATIIADVSRFAVYLKHILTPIIMLEQGVVLGSEASGVITGRDKTSTDVNIILP